MEYIVSGGRLQGELPVYGSKNCALALLGATVLTEDEVILNNCPDISDVRNMLLLLQAMGKKVWRCGDRVSVAGELHSTCAPRRYAALLRGSALILGSTVAKYHKIALPLPGGCAIGARPMDIHLSGLEALGVKVLHFPDMVSCSSRPKGAVFKLRFASVGATENLLCACSLAEGTSVLSNVAIEPEVVALERMLVDMGARIEGVGDRTVTVKGVRKLHGAIFDVIPDRIVAATYLASAVTAKGDLTVTNCCPQHLQAFLQLLQPYCSVKIYPDAVRIVAEKRTGGFGKVQTAPYPLFPTDMQSLLLSLAACADGTTVIEENLFENRLAHNAAELGKMGADVQVSGNVATVSGRNLHGAELFAADLRGGAGLVVAALSAEGDSVVHGIEHIERGYMDLAQNLRNVGAKIQLR